MSKKTELPEFHDPLYSPPKSVLDRPSTPIISAKATKAKPKVQEPKKSYGFELPEDPYEVEEEEETDSFADTFEGGVNAAFIAAGQGAGKIASAFHKLGYRKVAAINTTAQDFTGLNLPNTLVVGNDRGGAGKDPKEGEAASRESYEDIIQLLMESWGEQVDVGYVVVGGGGGSGTGSLSVLIEAVSDYFASLETVRSAPRRIGVILTLPKKSEGARVHQNALDALTVAKAALDDNTVSSVLLLDNSKIGELFPSLSIKQFWDVANSTFANGFHVFNILSAQDSPYVTFDKADYKSVLYNGITVFGNSKIEKWNGLEDIANSVRKNLKSSLLAQGMDFSNASAAAMILVAHNDVLDNLRMEAADFALTSLGRTLNNENLVLHSGIYEGNQPGMRCFVMLSGLGLPEARVEELKKLGNVT